MRDHAGDHRVSVMCKALGISRSGYHKWRKKRSRPRAKQREDAVLKEQIRDIHEQSKKTYGRPRLHQELQAKGFECGKHRLVRLMREEGIAGVQKKRFRVLTTQSEHPYAIAPNRLEGYEGPSEPDEVWVADITYVRTGEGWAYLAAILDMFSRRIVGWAMSERIDQQLTLTALRSALSNRKPPRIHHSDRGSQYACHRYRDLLRLYGIEASMSRKGNPYDNAMMESFFGTLKTEEIQGRTYRSCREARSELFAYIEAFYNTRRIHTSLAGLAPAQFEAQFHARELTA